MNQPHEEQGHETPALPRLWLEVTVTALLALIIVIVPLLAYFPEKPEPAAAINVAPGRLVVVPNSSRAEVRRLSRGLETFFKALYENAFLVQTSTSHSSPEPIGEVSSVEHGIGRFFTSRARSALRRHREVFHVEGFDVRNGIVQFSGVATLSGQATAFLDVQFAARARAGDALVAVRQGGSLLLLSSREGWRVAGFRLKLRTEPTTEATATPTPTGNGGH
jgi:hypothetical protein